MFTTLRAVRASRTLTRNFHVVGPRLASSPMQMPAMSPTMTEGTVSEWKVKEGDSFVAGDVLVTIETDKASIDVEAQDDGIVGKILVQDGTQNVQVGKLIAVLAEEGDDLSAIEVPSESSSTSASPAAPSPEPTPKAAEAPKAEITAPKPSPPANSPSKSQGAAATEGGHHDLPTHSRPLLPSVLRQLVLAGVTDTSKIKATGFKGQLSKGDVLAHLGLIKSANGSLKEAASHGAKPAAKTEAPAKPLKDLDGASFRKLIALGLGSPVAPKPIIKEVPTSSASGFDSVLDQYLPAAKRSTSAAKKAAAPSTPTAAKKDPFDALLEL